MHKKSKPMDFECHIFKTIGRDKYDQIAAAESAAVNLPKDISNFPYRKPLLLKAPLLFGAKLG